MGTPKRPLLTYISRDRGPEVACDPELLTKAWQHRISNQLLKAAHFKLNISVWKLEKLGGIIDYICEENISSEAMLEEAIELRKDRGMKQDEAEKSAEEYPTVGGIHSEVNIVAKIYRKPGQVLQVFSERKPCNACQAFMRNMFPAVVHTPFFYYLQPPGTERRWQLEPYGKSLKLYMLNRYQA